MRPIPNFPNYSITTDGKVFSHKNNRFLKHAVCKQGYLHVVLCNDNNPKRRMRVHRLVAMTYIPNPENKPCVDHLNRHRFDCRVKNLRWVSIQENCNNMVVGRGVATTWANKKKGNYGWRTRWSVEGKGKDKIFKTKEEAEAYRIIVYQFRCAIRKMRGQNY